MYSRGDSAHYDVRRVRPCATVALIRGGGTTTGARAIRDAVLHALRPYGKVILHHAGTRLMELGVNNFLDSTKPHGGGSLMKSHHMTNGEIRVRIPAAPHMINLRPAARHAFRLGVKTAAQRRIPKLHMPKADMSLIRRHGKTEGAAVKAECKTRAARTVRPVETYPEKVANCVASAAPHATAARERGGRRRPGRGGGSVP